MPTTDSLRETLELFRAQEKKAIEDLNAIRLTIRTIERAAGMESTDPVVTDSSHTLAVADEMPFPISVAGGKPRLRADEFFGLTQAEAARRYLKKVGHAISFEELVQALQEGGCKLTGANPQKVLYISLVRNTRDFVPPRPGFVGLREFYPARARVSTGGMRKNGAKKLHSVQMPRPSGKGKDGSRKPGEVSRAVMEVMQDRQSRSPRELADAVSAKLGRLVQEFAIRGAISGNRNLEQSEGKYRLVG